MKKISSILPRWIPALVMMGIIFLFSSRSAAQLPNFLSWDYVIKKAGHILEYGLLCSSLLYALGFESKYRRLAWALAILYSATDEFHQSFVPGRHPSLFDIFIFDNLGALIGLWLFSNLGRKRESKTPKAMKR